MALQFPCYESQRIEDVYEPIEESWIKCISPKIWRYDLFLNDFSLWYGIIEGNSWDVWTRNNRFIDYGSYSILSQNFNKRTLGFKNLNLAFKTIVSHIRNGTGGGFKQSELDMIEIYLGKNKFLVYLFYYVLGLPVKIEFEDIEL